MNMARTTVLDFLKRDLKLIKRIGTEQQKAEIPAIEAELERMSGNAEFATATRQPAADQLKQEAGK